MNPEEMTINPNVHRHGSRTHVHAHADIPHQHFLRAICTFEECKSFPTHNIHPRRRWTDEDRLTFP